MNVDLVAGALFAAGGIAGIGYGVWTLNRAWASQGWPTITGEILASEVVSELGDGTTLYKPSITYSYTVNGRSYRGDTIRFGGPLTASWRGPAEQTVDRFRPGRRCPVAYDPADASRSCLEVGAGWWVFGPPILGAVFLGVGILKLLGR